MPKPTQNALLNSVNALSEDDLIKAEAMDNGPIGDDEDDEDEDEDEDAMKSLPTEDDLLKSLSALNATANAVDNGTSLRQTQLAAKAASGEDLSKSERDELVSFLEEDGYGYDGYDDGQGDLFKSHAEYAAEDPTIAQGMEISEFLEAQTMMLCKSLDENVAAMRRGFGEQETYNGVLAKSLSALGGTVVRLMQKIDAMERGGAPRPVAPRGKTRVGQTFGESMNKSNTQQAMAPDTAVTPGMINDALDDLIKSSTGTGPQKGFVDGIDLVHEQAKFESVGQVAPAAMRLVLKHRGIDPSTVGL